MGEGTPPVCRRCGSSCEPLYEYELELESGSYPLKWFSCPGCGGEYLHAADLVTLEDVPMPATSDVGGYRKAALCHEITREGGDEPGGRSVGPLVATALEEDLIDAALLPDYGRGRELRVVTEPDEANGLRRAWAIPSRPFSVNAALSVSLDFLVGLERFAQSDGAAHPRLAVIGRPCHVYAARQANLAQIAPGYEIPLLIGLFCYGNVAPYGSSANRFEELTGLAPGEIRGMTVAEGNMRIAGADRHVVEVPLREFAFLLHPTCLKCVDFTVPWADLSLGEDPRIAGFDLVLVRSALGEDVFERAVGTGRLRAWSPPWMTGDEDSLHLLANLAAVKQDLAEVLR